MTDINKVIQNIGNDLSEDAQKLLAEIISEETQANSEDDEEYKDPYIVYEPEGLAKDIFMLRYAAPGETSWTTRANRIASHVANAESDQSKIKWQKKFKKAIARGDFIPGGRILFGSGRAKYNLLNCYVVIPEDSVESIGKTIQDMYKISCAGGGIGFNFSKIRPKGDHIQSIKNSAPGTLSVMQMINEIGDHVRAGKNRRVAIMGILNVDHPDILEFLHVKLDLNQLNNFNISVAITSRFLEACENNEEWYFTFNNKKYYVYQMNRRTPKFDENGQRTGEYDLDVLNIVAWDKEDAIERAKQHFLIHPDDQFTDVKKYNLKAKKLFEKIWDNAVNSGDPGFYNISLANKFTNVSYFEEMNSTNPCGEIPLPSYGNCCLGHVNLANMVDDSGEFDWRRFKYAVRMGIRFLDDVLDVNHFPTPECREVAHKSRRIGLGVMGYHYMLLKLGIRYGSEKCLEFTERLAETFRNEAYLASVYISKEKGAFHAFNSRKYLQEEFAQTLPPRIRMLIKKYGIRNAVMLTVAPTGTTSMVMNVSSGIEPIFAPMYKRRFRYANTWKEEVVLDPMFKKWVEENRPIEHFVGAYDVKPEDHMAVQAVWQRHIDSAISKTINLPATAKASDFVDIALEFAQYLKGLTVYRAGSKGREPLEAIPTTPETIRQFIPNAKEEMASADACRLGGDCG